MPDANQTIQLADIRAAQARVADVCARTPLIKLEGAGDNSFELFAKAESFQPIGSFKLRGAYNKISQLTGEQKARGVVAYSSGNHAQGVAFAARALGIKAVVVMPSNAPEIKRKGAESLGAEVVIVGVSSAERQQRAEELAAEFGYSIIPPYDDPQIIAGQATCGAEIVEDLPDVDLILTPIGGGGLISGVAAAAKLLKPGVKVYGVEPELAGDAAESFAAGRIIRYAAEQTSRTMADGLRTQSVGALNFMHIQEFVDGVIRINEDEIVAAMKELLLHWRLVVEPSGAVTTAAALFRHAELPPFRKAVVVVSGGNMEPSLLKSLL